jgi:ParB family transcriptional regulator, chromosome partitioning protein
MPQLMTKPLAWFKPDPKQPRKSFDEDKLRDLASSLKVRQNEPVQAKPDGTVIDGERRVRAARLVGLDKLDVIVTDQPLSDTELAVVRLTSFFHKADLSPYEKWLACAELMCGNPSWKLKDLAAHLQVAEGTVTKYLSPSKCIPAVQEALREGRIGITEVYEVSLLSPDGQKQALERKLAGASRDSLRRSAAIRGKGSASSSVRVGRVRLALAGGVLVVVAGPAISLDSLSETLADAQKEVRKARDQGLDVQVLQAVLRKKAGKAGAAHV